MYVIFKNSLCTSQQAQSSTDRPAGNVIYCRNERKLVKYTVCQVAQFLIVLHKVVWIFTAGLSRINRSYFLSWTLKQINAVSVCIPHSFCENLNIDVMSYKTNDSSWDLHEDIECSPRQYLIFHSVLRVITFNFRVFLISIPFILEYTQRQYL